MKNIQDNKIPRLVSRVFSRSTFRDIVNRNSNSVMDALFSCALLKTFKGLELNSVFDQLYEILAHDYRNEYVFKNSLALEIIKKKHQFNNVSYINELRTNNSICDIAIFNGKSTAYEIKTELDSLDRLPMQLSDYQKIFNRVYVITDKSKLSTLEKIVSPNIGICELTKTNKINIIKEADSNIDFLSNEDVFYCLRPSEIDFLLKEKLNYIPSGSAKERRKESLTIFTELNKETVNDYFIEAMKKRSLEAYEIDYFSKLPNSILALLLNFRLNKKKLLDLSEIMANPYSFI